MLVRRARAFTLVCALSLPVGLPVTVATATSAVAAPSTRAEAAALPAAVKSFRADVMSILRANMSSYGDRLSPTERKRMSTLTAQVNRDLSALERATARTASLTQSNAPRADRARAAATAAAAFDAGYGKALANLAEIQPLLQPKLSLFEALKAKSQLDTQMARYEELGARIHGVDASLRK